MWPFHNEWWHAGLVLISPSRLMPENTTSRGLPEQDGGQSSCVKEVPLLKTGLKTITIQCDTSDKAYVTSHVQPTFQNQYLWPFRKCLSQFSWENYMYTFRWATLILHGWRLILYFGLYFLGCLGVLHHSLLPFFLLYTEYPHLVCQHSRFESIQPFAIK